MKRFYSIYFTLVLFTALICLLIAYFSFGRNNPVDRDALVERARATVEKLESELRDLEPKHWWRHWHANYHTDEFKLYFPTFDELSESERANLSSESTQADIGSEGNPFAQRLIAGRDSVALITFHDEVLQQSRNSRERLNDFVWMLLALVPIPGIFGWLAIRPLAKRIYQLERGAQQFTSGNLSARVPVEGTDVVADLAASFNRMTSQVEELVGRNEEMLVDQREMLRAVAHDFRNPLARLRFALDMTMDANGKHIPELTTEMSHALDDLDSMVNEVLLFTRLQPGASALSLEPVSIDAVIEDAVSNTHILNEHLSIDSVTEGADAEEVMADPYYLQRAILNLIGNAARHAKMRVVVYWSVRDGDCQLRVEDDGPGVPPVYRNKIFEPFVRVDTSRSRRSGGSGLGLAIVQRIVEKHGGQAFVDKSKELGGASFGLRWPVLPPDSEIVGIVGSAS